jgi:heme/copper-type cytochrome/quinol oxidase subunit 2
MYIAMVFLILALIVARRQSAVDWKDQPEKRRPLRVLFSLIVFMIAVMIPVAFVFFG